MQDERTFHFNEEIAICRQRIERSVGTPMTSPDLGNFATQMFLEAIQQFDRLLFPSCPQKLQKLRVCPDQGHYAPCGFAWFQSALPQRRSVPDLLGDEPGRTGHPRHHFKDTAKDRDQAAARSARARRSAAARLD